MSPADVVVVGGSTAGASAMRELRRRGFDGTITLVDPEDGCNRPPLSKALLAGEAPDTSVLMDHTSLEAVHVRSRAVSLDPRTRRVHTAAGDGVRYDALVVATGSRARRLAATGRRGEVVLRTLEDARTLRRRLATSATVVVIGSGFLGMEVATAAARAGAEVTVVDPDPPLQRLLGPHLADALVRRAKDLGIVFRRSPATLVGDPVHGVELRDGVHLPADLVVSCVGDEPVTDWLDGTGLATQAGVEVDASARTGLPDVYAAGDVAAARVDGHVARRPYWANAVAQGKVAAASILGQRTDDEIMDEYVWTEIAGLALRVVGPLPPEGTPDVLEDAGDGLGILAWNRRTVAALGVRRPVPRLRSLAQDLARSAP
jgi:3-phenylpropionate/trans-cinnamate dioxygenase ferredoxin reductase component